MQSTAMLSQNFCGVESSNPVPDGGIQENPPLDKCCEYFPKFGLLPLAGDNLLHAVCRGLVCFQAYLNPHPFKYCLNPCSIIHHAKSRNCELLLTQPQFLKRQKKFTSAYEVMPDYIPCNWLCACSSWPVVDSARRSANGVGGSYAAYLRRDHEV